MSIKEKPNCRSLCNISKPYKTFPTLVKQFHQFTSVISIKQNVLRSNQCRDYLAFQITALQMFLFPFIYMIRLCRANTPNLQRSVLGGGAPCNVHILFAYHSLRSEAAFEPFAKTPHLDFIQHQCQLLPLSNLQLGTPPSQRKEVDLHPPFQPKRPSTSHCLPALFLKLVVIIKISEFYPCCGVRAQQTERR